MKNIGRRKAFSYLPQILTNYTLEGVSTKNADLGLKEIVLCNVFSPLYTTVMIVTISSSLFECDFLKTSCREKSFALTEKADL